MAIPCAHWIGRLLCLHALLCCSFVHVLLMQLLANASCSVNQGFIGVTLPCTHLFSSCSNSRFDHGKVCDVVLDITWL